MNNYELMVILSASVDDAAREELFTKVETILTSHGVEILGTDKWGVKKFAYPIAYKKEGFYVVYTLKADAENINKISAVLNITENVVRHLFIKK